MDYVWLFGSDYLVDNYGLSDYLVDNLCCELGFPPFVRLRVGLVSGSVDNRLKIRLSARGFPYALVGV